MLAVGSGVFVYACQEGQEIHQMLCLSLRIGLQDYSGLRHQVGPW